MDQTTTLPESSSTNPSLAYMPAKWTARLVNNILDLFFTYILGILVGGLIGLVSAIVFNAAPAIWLTEIIGYIVTYIYFALTESIWQRSPAKFITKTKVVTLKGTKPSRNQILGRTLARLIPFEALSFLSGHPHGWHDMFSKTLVVSSTYSAEDVQKIDSKYIQRNLRPAAIRAAIMTVIIVILAVAFYIYLYPQLQASRGDEYGNTNSDLYDNANAN